MPQRHDWNSHLLEELEVDKDCHTRFAAVARLGEVVNEVAVQLKHVVELDDEEAVMSPAAAGHT